MVEVIHEQWLRDDVPSKSVACLNPFTRVEQGNDLKVARERNSENNHTHV